VGAGVIHVDESGVPPLERHAAERDERGTGMLLGDCIRARADEVPGGRDMPVVVVGLRCAQRSVSVRSRQRVLTHMLVGPQRSNMPDLDQLFGRALGQTLEKRLEHGYEHVCVLSTEHDLDTAHKLYPFTAERLKMCGTGRLEDVDCWQTEPYREIHEVLFKTHRHPARPQLQVHSAWKGIPAAPRAAVRSASTVPAPKVPAQSRNALTAQGKQRDAAASPPQGAPKPRVEPAQQQRSSVVQTHADVGGGAAPAAAWQRDDERCTAPQHRLLHSTDCSTAPIAAQPHSTDCCTAPQHRLRRALLQVSLFTTKERQWKAAEDLLQELESTAVWKDPAVQRLRSSWKAELRHLVDHNYLEAQEQEPGSVRRVYAITKEGRAAYHQNVPLTRSMKAGGAGLQREE
jgi:hypothetical protein